MSNNILSTTDAGVVNDTEYTHMVTLFGQWNDHDLTFTPFSPSIRSFSNGINCDESCEHTEPCIPIPVGVKAQTKLVNFVFNPYVLLLRTYAFQMIRYHLETPAFPPAQTAASQLLDLLLPAEPVTLRSILVENPARGSR